MNEKKSKTKKPKRAGASEAPADEKPVRRRKPDAMARAQAEVEAKAPPVLNFTGDATTDDVASADAADALEAPERRPAEILAEAAATPVSPPGPIAGLPSPTPHALRMADLSPLARRALANIASNMHRTQAQLDAFADDPSIPYDKRAPMGSGELVKHGLAVERRAFFLTARGAKIVENAGIEVTRPVVSAAVASEVAS